MARGGYISAGKAISKLFRTTGSRSEAERLIIDALISGMLRSRGRPQMPKEMSKPINGGNMSLRDLSSSYGDVEVGELAEIPSSFWQNLSIYTVECWDWFSGNLFNNNAKEDVLIYVDVYFEEKGLNQLEKLRKPVKPVAEKKPRLRNASWHEWVAAVATIAAEQQILPTMTSSDLRSRIDAKLEKWGLEEKEITTVAPTIRAILKRFNETPPVPQLRLPSTSKPK